MSIITSILDNDFYKFTMSRFLSEREEGNLEARYHFNNRSENKAQSLLGINSLRNEFENLLAMGISFSEMKFLSSNGFPKDYLDRLNKEIAKNKVKINVVYGNGEYVISITGPWWLAALYETPCLAIINEMYTSAIEKRLIHDQKKTILDNLDKSIGVLDRNRVSCCDDFFPKIIEFGTRRRHSKEVQKEVVARLVEENIIIGSSNVSLCKELDIQPKGTMAHEIPMGMVALAKDDEKYHTEGKVISDWINLFPETYWLTDTFGSVNFLDRNHSLIENGEIGLRHDSGDPIDWLNMIPGVPKLMFSDGLDAFKIVEIFNDAIVKGWTHNQISFGWGTNLTNNSYIKPLSIVIKLTEINNMHTCKLSDNIKKACGRENVIEQYKAIFNYSNNIVLDEECRY